MKKCRTSIHAVLQTHCMLKLLRIMKLSTFLFLVGTLQILATGVYSQETDLTINLGETNVGKVLTEIEKQSEFYFLFNQKLVDTERKVIVQLTDKKIEEVLDLVFSSTNTSYVVMDRQIVLSPKEYLNDIITALEKEAEIQAAEISGTVTGPDGEAMPGVSIVVKGTTNGTITDSDGQYYLSDVPEGAVLVFSFIGMRSQEVAVGNQTVIDLVMEYDEVGIDEVIVVGYGTQTKGNLTGAIANIKSDKLEEISESNLSSMLAGRLSGVYVSNWTGTPGVSSDISIRSVGSINANPPVFVIDGVIREKRAFDALDPSEIQEISVLKDAASAALYGSRSAGGVVLVATKSGSATETRINYTASYSMDSPIHLPEMMRGADIARMGNSIAQPTDWWYKDDNFINWMETVDNGYGYNYIDDVYVTPTNMRHSLNASGGNQKIQYFIGGSYFDQQGWLEPLTYNKFNMRASVTAKITDNLTAHMNLSQFRSNRSKFWWPYDWGSEQLGDLWKKLQTWQYYWPHYIEGKPWNYGWLGNVGELITNSGYWRNRENVQNSLFSLTYEVPFVRGLSVKATYNSERYNSNLKNFQKKHTLYNIEGAVGDNYENAQLVQPYETVQSNGPSREYLEFGNGEDRSYQFNLQVDYKKSFGDHNVNAFLVYEQWERDGSNLSGVRYDFPVVLKDQYFATSGDWEDSYFSGNEHENGRLSYIGQASYDYAKKYFLSASFRYDGSLAFSPDRRWGLFPSLSAAWVISEESFFNSNAVTYLKLRGSLGMLGNDNIGMWRWLESYQAANGFYFGESPKSTKGLSYGGIVNPNVTWEKSLTYNFGVDAFLFNAVSFSAEYWFKNTYDILGSRLESIPTTFGGNMPPENYGEVHSNGIELELGYNGKIGSDFNYFINGNFSYATNKVVKWDQPENIQDWQNRIGRPLGYITGLQNTGLLRTQADLDALPNGYTIYGAQPQLGWINYQDNSGIDGTPDGKIDDYDRVVLHNHSTPPISYGLTLGLEWKGISMEAFFQGLAGHYKYPSVQPPYAWTRVYSFWEDYWSPSNPNASMPMPHWDYWQNRAASDFYYRSASFARLRYLKIGYTLPEKISSKIKARSLRIYVSGTNLFTLSKFKVYDPELSNAGTFPLSRSLTGGISVTF